MKYQILNNKAAKLLETSVDIKTKGIYFLCNAFLPLSIIFVKNVKKIQSISR
jgi:hypothetical protein